MNVCPSPVVTVFVSGSTFVTSSCRILTRRGLREDRSDRSGDVGRPELGGRDLIEERLELLVVVTVDECHGDVVLRELLRASNTGEAGAHDHHGGLLRFV